MNDDQYLLASAYLDGELDAAERAAAASDPEVMAEVDRLRALQADVRFVEPPSDAVRESAITAALDEFDALFTAATRTLETQPLPASPARVVEFRPRPAYARWLGAAAAVVAIGFVGVVVARSAGGGDDDDAGAADLQALDDAAGSDADSARIAEAPAAESSFSDAADNSVMSTAYAATDATGADSSATASAAENATATTELADATAAPSGDAPLPTIAAAGTAPPFDPAVPIADEQALGLVGRELLDREAKGTLGATPDTVCGAGEGMPPILDEGLYQTTAGPVPVMIAVDHVTRETTAFDRDSCEVVATAIAP
jgi:negative regulator of sigma E activity